MGIAGAISIAMSGFIFHAAGHLQAFMFFAVIAGMATLSAWFLLPETAALVGGKPSFSGHEGGNR
jgi:hypothetical protein